MVEDDAVQSQSTMEATVQTRRRMDWAWRRRRQQLYGELDLALSWSERDLPERERTKHVHRLHPYLGKFVPQLVEALLERYVRPGGRVLDPFAGSGTTLVQALESGYDAVGVDIAAFNALLISVKTREHDLELLDLEVRDAAARLGARRASAPTGFVREWFAPQAAAELLHFRSLIHEYASQDVLRVVLARAARSARLTTHFDLDFPRAPSRASTGATSTAARAGRSRARASSSRATSPTRRRGSREFGTVRDPRRAALVLHGDARELELGGPYDGVVTSPPYPGLIDYHEQHRYAYELLGLDDRRERELGAAARGTSKAALEEYVAGIAAVLARSKARCGRALRSASSSTTGAGSIRRSSSGPGCGSTSGSSARQPAYGAARRRVLRVDPDLPLKAGHARVHVSAQRAAAVMRVHAGMLAHTRSPPVTRVSLPSTVCSRAPSPTRSSASSRAASRSRRTSTAACPGFAIVGLATEPARRRSIGFAAGSARPQLEWPLKRITVNLAPAGLRKEGSGFDLAIALAVLAASHQVPPSGSPSTRRSASSRSTGGCGRCAARSRWRRGARRAGLDRILCAWESACEAELGGVEAIAVDISPRPSRTCAASCGRRRPTRPTKPTSPICLIWPRSAVRSGRAARSSSRRRAATTCCSPDRRAPARRCWRGGCPRSCRRSSRARRSR